MEEKQNNHESMLRAINSKEVESNLGKAEAAKQVTEINDQHNKVLREMEQAFEAQKNRL